MSTSAAPDALHFPASSRPFLEPYLPPPTREKVHDKQSPRVRPFTTLTFATSLDSALSLAPGLRTVLSGPQSKAMTHYLRSRHDAILIGVGTAIADDPGLNCRIEGADGYRSRAEDDSSTSDPVIEALATRANLSDPELKQLMKAVAQGQASPEQMQAFQSHIEDAQIKRHADLLEIVRRRQETLQQPRPIVIDPHARWDFHENSKILSLVRQGKGKAPYVVISKDATPSQGKHELLQEHGGKFISIDTVAHEDDGTKFSWDTLLHVLATQENIQSIMIEGGGSIINSILSDPEYSAAIDSVIVTIAPTWLGQGGVVVSPQRRVDESGCPVAASRLTDVNWHPFGEDVVLLGRLIKH